MSGLINELSVDHAIVNDCRQLARGRALRVQHQPAPDGDAPASAWMSPNFKPPGSAQVADQPTAGIATFASTTEPPAATTRPSVASARTARRHRSAASQQRRRPDQDADCQRTAHPVADRRSARRAVRRRCRSRGSLWTSGPVRCGLLVLDAVPQRYLRTKLAAPLRTQPLRNHSVRSDTHRPDAGRPIVTLGDTPRCVTGARGHRRHSRVARCPSRPAPPTVRRPVSPASTATSPSGRAQLATAKRSCGSRTRAGRGAGLYAARWAG